jgi:hypothetical protein
MKMECELPPEGTILYKYYSPQNSILVLSSGSVRFSPIIEFNDPFELNAFPVYKFSQEEFCNALASVIHGCIENDIEIADQALLGIIKVFKSGVFINQTSQDFSVWLARLMAKNNIPLEPSENVRTTHLHLSKAIGAFCLTETFDNLLMWAHYAANHEGFVIGFDPHRAKEAFQAMAPVKYQSDYPSITDPFRSARTFIGIPDAQAAEDYTVRNFFTKSRHWAYEKEWRAVRSHDCDFTADHRTFDKSKQIVPIPPEAFISLHIGCRAQQEFIDDCVAKAKGLNDSIKIYKSGISSSSFSLQFQVHDQPWPQG